MFLCVPGKEVKGLQEMSVCECVMEMGRAVVRYKEGGVCCLLEDLKHIILVGLREMNFDIVE